MPEFERPRHRLVLSALRVLNADFLAKSGCYFGGGTRIVLGLDEYRESLDVDLLCASLAGYRALRSTVTDKSLGKITNGPVKLAREVAADRYGIRTFLDVDGEKLKLEIILEGRIALTGGMVQGLPVPALDAVSCFAEKFLANADRWVDTAVMGRDVIDLAFMAARWGPDPLRTGLEVATQAYGRVVKRDALRAAAKMIENASWRRSCVAALTIADTRTLLAGLRALVASVKNPRRDK